MKLTQILPLSLILFANLAYPPARAGGSLMLSDIDSLIQQSSQLETEIRIVLAETNRKFTEIVCVGGRISSRYGALGGARFAPFRCLFGEQLLTIEADNIVDLPDGSSFPLVELHDRESLPQEMSLSFQLRSWSWGKID
ncbi:MAG: hypothetical protein AB4290_26575 [Spirulina sp.]